MSSMVLKKRLISALVMLFLLGSVGLFATPNIQPYCVSLILMIALIEWWHMMGLKAVIMLSLSLFWLMLSVVKINQLGFFMLFGLSLLGLMFFLWLAFRGRQHSASVCTKIVEVSYSLILFLCLKIAMVGLWAMGWPTLLWAMSVVWITDTMAYFAGKAIGKVRCFGPVSPNKTLEGCLAGFFAGILVFMLGPMMALFQIDVSWWWRLMIAIMAVLFAIFGDLLESGMKRFHHVKDSGGWIPGHGGLWDRIDAMMFTLPFLWFTQYVFVFGA